MAHSEFLFEFRDVHAREISRWDNSIEEVRRCAGSDAGWPVEVSVFRRWHVVPLPPGTSYEEQQLAAVMLETAGAMKIPEEEKAFLAARIGRRMERMNLGG